MANVFNSASKNLGANEKHFKGIELYSFDKEITLEDNIFGDITFERFYGVNVIRIGSNAFNKTANKIQLFFCLVCSIEQQPPKYDIKTILNQMTELGDLTIGLNIDEIPSNALQPIGGQPSKLGLLLITAHQNITVKSGAFENLNQLYYINIYNTNIKTIEKEAFKFIDISNRTLRIAFQGCNLTNSGDSFQNGSFDGSQRQLDIHFQRTNINYFNEGVFKSVLDNKLNTIYFFEDTSLIDCEDCRNYWLIEENKKNQLKTPICRQNITQTLFDEIVKTKLYIKCIPIDD